MINYTNKEQLQDDTTIDRKNKVTADDMNEIKSSVNNLYTQLGLSTDTYSNTSTYALNDRVCYNNQLWKCTTAITTPEAWNESHWELIPIIKF